MPFLPFLIIFKYILIFNSDNYIIKHILNITKYILNLSKYPEQLPAFIGTIPAITGTIPGFSPISPVIPNQSLLRRIPLSVTPYGPGNRRHDRDNLIDQ